MKKLTKRILQGVPIAILAITGAALGAKFIQLKIIEKNSVEFLSDRTSNFNSINVMLTRPENWHKINTGKITLNSGDFANIDGSTATIPITAELVRQFLDVPDDRINEYFHHYTTHYAYCHLIFGNRNWKNAENDLLEQKSKSSSLIFVTEPSEDELKDAEACGIELDVQPVALDGFVFITHKDNPVNSLTVEQIQQIYSGNITNWKEVGGDDAEIIPYQRERNSGSQTAMEQLVMQGIPMMKPKEAYYMVEDMGGLIEYIAEYSNRSGSIGYTYYYYLSNLYRSDDIKVLAIDGISPDNENLTSHAYPFTTAYYAVMRKGENGKMKELRDYLLTDEGQEIIRLAGYCPVNGE